MRVSIDAGASVEIRHTRLPASLLRIYISGGAVTLSWSGPDSAWIDPWYTGSGPASLDWIAVPPDTHLTMTAGIAPVVVRLVAQEPR